MARWDKIFKPAREMPDPARSRWGNGKRNGRGARHGCWFIYSIINVHWDVLGLCDDWFSLPCLEEIWTHLNGRCAKFLAFSRFLVQALIQKIASTFQSFIAFITMPCHCSIIGKRTPTCTLDHAEQELKQDEELVDIQDAEIRTSWG